MRAKNIVVELGVQADRRERALSLMRQVGFVAIEDGDMQSDSDGEVECSITFAGTTPDIISRLFEHMKRTMHGFDYYPPHDEDQLRDRNQFVKFVRKWLWDNDVMRPITSQPRLDVLEWNLPRKWWQFWK